MRWKGWLTLAVVLLIVALLIAYGYRPRPVPVEVAEVQRGPLRVTVEEEGKTRVTDRYVVSAPVAGFAQRVTLKVGDPVKAGQALLSLEPLRSTVLDPRSRAEAEARVDVAEAALNAAQEKARAAAADAGYWEKQLARLKELQKTGDISQEMYDRTASEARRADAALRSAEHGVEQARSEVKAAQAALRYSAATQADKSGEIVAVRAPVSGRVLKVLHESAGVVNPGETLLEVGNARTLEVEVEVLSADAVRIRPGTRVLFERWGGSVPLEGRVRLVEPVAFTKISALGVEEQRVRVIVDFTSPLEQWNRLGDGYRVEASFVLWEGEQVLQVPASALFRYQQGWAVFVIQDSVARRRVVEVGHRTGLAAEVLSVLTQGEKVIIHPDDTIEDGKPVRPRS